MAVHTTEVVSTEPEKRKRGRPSTAHLPFKILFDSKGKKYQDIYRKNNILPNQTVYIVEVPPQRMKMRVYDYVPILDVAMPWLYYTIKITDGHKSRYGDNPGSSTIRSLVARSSKWRSSCDRFYYIPMPNLYPGTRTFCQNRNTLIDGDKYSLINQSIANFWGARFSYLVTDRETEIWNKLFDLCGAEHPADRHVDRSLKKIYTWWSKLSVDEVKKMPWGKKDYGTLTDLLKWLHFGSDHFSY